jgi:hypothetical protein
MEKSALAGEEWGFTPTLFQPIIITYKVAVYAPAEWTDALAVFHLYQYMYSVVHTNQSIVYIVHTDNGRDN